MKNKLTLIILLIMIFITVGCGANKQSNDSGDKKIKEYNISGISFKLDDEDSNSKMKYKTSKSFDKKIGSSTTTYYLYYDKNKDKYDVSNIVFSYSVTANIMQTQSSLEYTINRLNSNSSLKNISRSQKNINNITWEYVTLDNYYDSNTTDHFSNHSYYYETYDGKYYTTYTVSFNKVDNIEEVENDILNSIVLE